jgi:hypothetical protein
LKVILPSASAARGANPSHRPRLVNPAVREFFEKNPHGSDMPERPPHCATAIMENPSI